MKTKLELRIDYKQRRAALSVKECEIFMAFMVEQYCQLLVQENRQVVHLFLPISKWNEVNTWLLLKALNEQFPTIQTLTSILDVQTQTMKTVKVHTSMSFIENAWGIPEPEFPEYVQDVVIDEVIIPLLAYDLKGNRVGYGKGFYDQFLKTCLPAVKKTGLSFFEPEPAISNDPWDVPLQRVITPHRVYNMV
jgi:5-formyltetrahydrofolate cyclo-ligase